MLLDQQCIYRLVPPLRALHANVISILVSILGKLGEIAGSWKMKLGKNCWFQGTIG